MIGSKLPRKAILVRKRKPLGHHYNVILAFEAKTE